MICRFKVKYQVLHKKKKGKITVLSLGCISTLNLKHIQKNLLIRVGNVSGKIIIIPEL